MKPSKALQIMKSVLQGGNAPFLLGGTGVGYSVQKHHVEKLPEVTRPNMNRTRRFLVNDSIEGWADAVQALVRNILER